MGDRQIPSRCDVRSAGHASWASLLDELQAEYPDVSRQVVREILDRAHLAARLGTGTTDVDPRRVASAARDRLAVLRWRSQAARRRHSDDLCGASDAPSAGAAAPGDRQSG